MVRALVSKTSISESSNLSTATKVIMFKKEYIAVDFFIRLDKSDGELIGITEHFTYNQIADGYVKAKAARIAKGGFKWIDMELNNIYIPSHRIHQISWSDPK